MSCCRFKACSTSRAGQTPRKPSSSKPSSCSRKAETGRPREQNKENSKKSCHIPFILSNYDNNQIWPKCFINILLHSFSLWLNYIKNKSQTLYHFICKCFKKWQLSLWNLKILTILILSKCYPLFKKAEFSCCHYHY